MTNAPLAEQLRTDLSAAMKSKDEVTLRTLRMVIAAVQSAEVAGSEAVALDDASVIKVLQKQATQRSDSAKAFADAGRTDRAEAELAERAVIERYLPAALSEAELQAIVDEEVANYSGDPKAAMGMIIKAVNGRTAGRADGKQVAALVKAKLG